MKILSVFPYLFKIIHVPYSKLVHNICSIDCATIKQHCFYKYMTFPLHVMAHIGHLQRGGTPPSIVTQIATVDTGHIKTTFDIDVCVHFNI
jgi:hypothetical protein